jgi:hypothetical protein
MSQDSDFFGDVFDDPEDDPLLGGDSRSSDDPAPDAPDRQGPPSWMSEEPSPNGEASASDVDPDPGPTRKQILVDQQGDAGAGLDALNQAVGQGWRLVRINLARPDGEQAPPSRAARRFVAILEQDRPQSLFDFGAAT